MSVLSAEFTIGDIGPLRHAVTVCALTAGLHGDQLDGFVFAVNELVTNAVRHGGGHGHLELRHNGDLFGCQVTDYGGSAAPPITTASALDTLGGRGLWMASQLTDQLHLRQRPDGLTATVAVRLPASPPPI